MAVKHVDLDDRYIPKTDDQDIIVDVKIGDGQDGTYAVFLGGDLIKANSPANLGGKTNLKNKNTIVSATVVDELEETNWTSITVKISEGSDVTTFGPYKAQAEDNNDTVIYTLKLIHQ